MLTRGKWSIDKDARILTYKNGRSWRVFCLPPDDSLTPDQAVAWVSGTETGLRVGDDDLKDLSLAVRDVLGPGHAGAAGAGLRNS